MHQSKFLVPNMRQRTSLHYFWTRRSFVSRAIKVLLMAALGGTLFLNVFFLALQHDSSRHKEASSHRQPRNLRQQVSKERKKTKEFQVHSMIYDLATSRNHTMLKVKKMSHIALRFEKLKFLLNRWRIDPF